ncbi:hemerythrin domain-containing protein [Peterkaempfera sp. SMS 1(5)a]|uniref:hemerythrin domain-containing protein n=1 Tax=Peterkaempfera podocarpi TaxID=3232308 RepID=UPI00366BE0F2
MSSMSAPHVLAQDLPEIGTSTSVGSVRFAGLLLVHAALRRDLVRLPGAIRTLGPRDDDRGHAVVRRWRFLVDMLVRYHEYQDVRLWPTLRRRAPELRLLANWLEADHHDLEQSAAGTTASVLEGALTRTGTWSAAHAVEGFAIELQGHLRIEETQVMPAMREVIESDAVVGTLPDLLRCIRGDTGPGTADILTWLLEGVPRRIADELLHQCDDTVVRHWPHWRDTYARVSDEVWGDPPHTV